MFKTVRALQNVVITGNPGVGKSWFQVRFLLFCIRPDLYKALSGDAEFPRDFRGSHDPPKYIFRMIAERTEGCIFDVANMRVLPPFDAGFRSAVRNPGLAPDCTVLFEPADDNKRMAPFRGFRNSQFIMTVSPERNRYDEFVKQKVFTMAGLLVMPCHFAAEIMAMGRVLRARFESTCISAPAETTPENDFSPDKIRSRMRKYGPFIRYVLNPHNISAIDLRRKQTFKELNLDTLLSAGRTIERGRDSGASRHHVSTWILRYAVPRDDSGHVTSLHIADTWLVESSPEVRKLLFERLLPLDVGKRVRLLEDLLQGAEQDKTRAGTVYQGLVETWLFHRVPFPSFTFALDESAADVCDRSWVSLNLPNFTRTNRGSVPFADMEPAVLYHPADPNYPFVEMMWRQGDEVFAVQVTASDTHAKTFDTTFHDYWLKRRLNVSLADIGSINDGKADNKADNTDAPTRINVVYVLRPDSVNKMKDEIVNSGFAWKKYNDSQVGPLHNAGVLKYIMAKPSPGVWKDALHPTSFDRKYSPGN